MTVSAVAALVSFGASACGGGGDGSGNKVASLSGHTATTRAASRGNKKDFQDAMLEYARCMRQHGVDMPDPTFSDGGKGVMIKAGGRASPVDKNKMEDAEKACQSIMDRAEQNAPRPTPEQEAEMRERALTFARCMREHGVDIPDPTFDGEGHTKIRIGREAPANGSDGPDTQTDGPATNGGGPNPDDPKFQAAQKACAPEGGGPIGFSTSTEDK
jgi:hypothetical protein